MLEIEIVPALNDNYIYIVHNRTKLLTAVVDPGDPGPVINKLNEKNWKLNQIINTHHHNDHTDGNKKLLEIFNPELIAPIYDQNRIKDVNKFVSDNDFIEIVGVPAKVIFTPGHTLGHVCYYFDREKILFSGDTLFHLGCGRVFEGTMEQMKNSLKKIKNLPDDTKVYCGHEYTLSNAKFCLSIQPNNKMISHKYDKIDKLRKMNIYTVPFELDEEKRLNPFLQFDNKDFKDIMNLSDKNETEVFEFVRNQKDSF